MSIKRSTSNNCTFVWFLGCLESTSLPLLAKLVHATANTSMTIKSGSVSVGLFTARRLVEQLEGVYLMVVGLIVAI